jgi:hypothetical protein
MAIAPRSKRRPSYTDGPPSERMANQHDAYVLGWCADEFCVNSTFGLVFERELKTSAIGHHLFALDLDVELGHFG